MGRPLVIVWLWLAAACARGGDGTLWVGLPGAAVLAAFDGGDHPARLVEPPALDGPVRAVVARRDGTLVALQDAGRGGPPAVLLSCDGRRLATFEGADATGAPLFDPTLAPDPVLPWAAAEDRAGRIWVTGARAPAVFHPDGRLAFVAQALPFPTRGIAALPDGRVLVGSGVADLTVYAPDGAVAQRLPGVLGPGYDGLDALLAEPEGTLLVATRRFGVTSEGLVLRAAIGPGGFALAQDPGRSAVLGPGIPSALARAGEEILAAPSLGALAAPGCVRRLSGDLGEDRGCAAPGRHRGVTWAAAR